MLPTVAPDPPTPNDLRRVATCRTRPYYRPSSGSRPPQRPPIPGRRGGSWRPTPPSASIPAWTSASSWLSSLAAALQTREGDARRRQLRIRLETALDVAAEDARAADSRTGRHVTTAHATVAAILGCSSKTVQRARLLVEALGYATTVTGGRYLTSTERAAAHLVHGGDQRRMASERALTLPRTSANVHLPRRGDSSSTTSVSSGLPSDGVASRPPRRKNQKRNNQRTRPSLAVQKLAAGLARDVPWLARMHIGRLCHGLEVLKVDHDGWTSRDLLTVLDAYRRLHGWAGIDPSHQRDPVALFIAQLRPALAEVTETPKARRRREQHDRESQSASAAASRAQLAAHQADPAVQERISQAQADARAALRAVLSRSRVRRHS